MLYIKTSAFTGQNVNELFEETIELVYNQKIKAKIQEGKQSEKDNNIIIGQTQPLPPKENANSRCCWDFFGMFYQFLSN